LIAGALNARDACCVPFAEFTQAATMPWNDLGWWWFCCDPRKQESFSKAASSGKLVHLL
jgi:hypothetical protein